MNRLIGYNFGKLLGRYTYREIEEKAQSKLKLSLRDQFTSAGFQVEIEEKYPLIKTWQYDAGEFICEVGDYNIELVQGDIFYVLRKVM